MEFVKSKVKASVNLAFDEVLVSASKMVFEHGVLTRQKARKGKKRPNAM